MGKDQYILVVQGVENRYLTKKRLLHAVAERESGWRPWVIGGVGEVGLFQITSGVLDDFNRAHQTVNTGQDLLDPYINTVIGAWYLYEELPRIIRYGGMPVTVGNVLMAYNGGPGNLIRGTVSSAARAYADQVAQAAGYRTTDPLSLSIAGIPWQVVAGAGAAAVWKFWGS